MTSIICITCPKGCRLSVDEENGYKVTGNGCPRGEIYGKNELQHPVRVITSTVRIEGAAVPRLRSRPTSRCRRRRCSNACTCSTASPRKVRSGSETGSQSISSARTSISSRQRRCKTALFRSVKKFAKKFTQTFAFLLRIC